MKMVILVFPDDGIFCVIHCLLQVIAVNGKFPGPIIDVTTNNNVVVNVKNKLDEDLLITWYSLVEYSKIYLSSST